MKKKYLLIGTSLIVGSTMFFTTAFASVTNTSGYSTYKSALKNTMKAESFAGNFEILLKDNGKVIADMDAGMKADHKKETVSGKLSIKSEDDSFSADLYSLDGKTVVKGSNSDTYNIIDGEKNRHEKRNYSHCHDAEAEKLCEMIVDTVVGNMKNYVTSERKPQGGSTVYFKLSENQIPTLVNAVTSLAVKASSEEHNKEKNHIKNNPLHLDMDIEHPKLVDDIRIKNVEFNADINKENYIEEQKVGITMVGKDEKGIKHEVVLSVNMDFEGFNHTKPDTVDLKGKKVKTIKHEDLKNYDWGNVKWEN